MCNNYRHVKKCALRFYWSDEKRSNITKILKERKKSQYCRFVFILKLLSKKNLSQKDKLLVHVFKMRPKCGLLLFISTFLIVPHIESGKFGLYFTSLEYFTCMTFVRVLLFLNVFEIDRFKKPLRLF